MFQLSLIILLRLQRFLEAYKYIRDPFFVATYPSRKEPAELIQFVIRPTLRHLKIYSSSTSIVDQYLLHLRSILKA